MYMSEVVIITRRSVGDLRIGSSILEVFCRAGWLAGWLAGSGLTWLLHGWIGQGLKPEVELGTAKRTAQPDLLLWK